MYIYIHIHVHIYIHTYILTTNTFSLTLGVLRGKTAWGYKPGRRFSPETKPCRPWSGTLNLQGYRNINGCYLSHATCGISYGSPCRLIPSEFATEKYTRPPVEGWGRAGGRPPLCYSEWKSSLETNMTTSKQLLKKHGIQPKCSLKKRSQCQEGMIHLCCFLQQK